jgi:hypothetical protein
VKRARTSTKQRIQALALSIVALLSLGYGLGRLAGPQAPASDTGIALAAR